MNRNIAAAVVVTLGLSGAGWLWFATPSAPPAKAPVATPTPAAATPASPPSTVTSPASVAAEPSIAPPLPAEPLPLPPALRKARWLSEVYEELLQRAEAGDVAAMLELGHRLSLCSDNEMASQRQQLQRDRKSLSGDEKHEWSPTAQANIQKRIDTTLRVFAECEALPQSQRSRGFDWMEKAAASGWGKAQLDYVQFALGEFRALHEDEAIIQIEEFLRRRALAQRFMAEALTHCVPEALNVQTFAAGLLFGGRDSRDAAINRAAAADAAAREGSASGAQAVYIEGREHDFNYFLGDLDAAARAEARRRGEAMFNTCAPR